MPYVAAVALPATILKIADVIDNPWQMAVDRSKKAGVGKTDYVYDEQRFNSLNHVVLANVLEERVQGNRPCNLVSTTSKHSVLFEIWMYSTSVYIGSIQLWVSGCLELFTRAQ